MTGWLLDTNFLSELRRPRPEPGVTAFVAACALSDRHVSAVTFAEIRFGIERLAGAANGIARIVGMISDITGQTNLLAILYLPYPVRRGAGRTRGSVTRPSDLI